MAQAGDGEACFSECHLTLPADGKERKGAGQGEELFRIREADGEFFIRRCAVREESAFFIRMEREDVPQEKFIGGKTGFEACAPNDGVNTAFLPMTTVRLYFEAKYWIDAVIKEAPVFTYSLRTVLFAVQLLAPYPYWKSVKEHYYKLGGSTGGFNFPVSYDTPHNFEQFNETLFLNCVNRGNTRVDYSAEIRCTSGQAANITLTNAGNQKFIAVKTTLTAADTVRISPTRVSDSS